MPCACDKINKGVEMHPRVHPPWIRHADHFTGCPGIIKNFRGLDLYFFVIRSSNAAPDGASNGILKLKEAGG